MDLATRPLVDGFNGDYEQAVVVSNDANFPAAMRYVRDGLDRRVTLVNPDRRNTSPRELAQSATYFKRLWKSHLRSSQFPDIMKDTVGIITKPPGGERPATASGTHVWATIHPQATSHVPHRRTGG